MMPEQPEKWSRFDVQVSKEANPEMWFWAGSHATYQAAAREAGWYRKAGNLARVVEVEEPE